MDNYVPATLTIHQAEASRKFKIPELMTSTLYYYLCDRATIHEKILGPSKSNPTKAVDTMFKDKKQGPPVPFENTMIVLLPNPLICHPSNSPNSQAPTTITGHTHIHCPLSLALASPQYSAFCSDIIDPPTSNPEIRDSPRCFMCLFHQKFKTVRMGPVTIEPADYSLCGKQH